MIFLLREKNFSWLKREMNKTFWFKFENEFARVALALSVPPILIEGATIQIFEVIAKLVNGHLLN